MEKIFVIIPAAGFGKRMNHPVAKQFLKIASKSILEHTTNKFLQWARQYNHYIEIIIPLSEGMNLPFCAGIYGNNIRTCLGGELRSDSVKNALGFIEKEVTNQSWIMVHDAARPLVDEVDIERLYQALKNDDIGGLLVSKLTSTIKKSSNDTNNKSKFDKVLTTVCRNNLYQALTPQLFRYSLLKDSLMVIDKSQLTDESSGIEMLGYQPTMIIGKPSNIKITYEEDLEFAEFHLNKSR